MDYPSPIGFNPRTERSRLIVGRFTGVKEIQDHQVVDSGIESIRKKKSGNLFERDWQSHQDFRLFHQVIEVSAFNYSARPFAQLSIIAARSIGRERPERTTAQEHS